MATATTEQAQPAASGGTSPGNYFVANYPPFSLWSPQFIEEVHTVLGLSPQPHAPLGIYVHIPFCRKRCHFCYFKVLTGTNAQEIKRYLSALVQELEFYAAKPFIGGRVPKFIYFGGGTPSYLSQTQLLFLTDHMKRLLP